MVEPDRPFGLVESSLLEKIDKLFACNVGSHVDLPQLVVVGNQSSGKSSVLAALTDLPFPRDSGLCTRFATQIIFRRAATSFNKVSIIPSKESSTEHQRKMKDWTKQGFDMLDADSFADIMQEVSDVMGIGSSEIGIPRAFSSDVLVIEITGPNEEHFSIIDIPGTFKLPEDGVTTKDDMEMVDNMVYGYMSNPRSVILTVVPCNVDIANQDVIEKAAVLDLEGNRTFGILTKPDLMEGGSEQAVVDLIEGKRHKLKLGWHLLRNPGKSELGDPSKSRQSIERAFFSQDAPWNRI